MEPVSQEGREEPDLQDCVESVKELKLDPESIWRKPSGFRQEQRSVMTHTFGTHCLSCKVTHRSWEQEFDRCLSKATA